MLPRFLSFIGDPDLVVRRITLVTFNSAVHNKSQLVKPLLPEILPMVYKETEVRKDLIRIVEVGPFKQNFDDGLDARKVRLSAPCSPLSLHMCDLHCHKHAVVLFLCQSAFEACLTLLENCSDALDVPDFVAQISKGLLDQHDIQVTLEA